jgi:protein-tyrosine-phosphatase
VCERIAIALSRRLQATAERFLCIPYVRRALHRRALRAWRSTETPLILCYGNINRSPYAAALAKRDQGKAPASAGFYPVCGRRSPTLTIDRAGRYGVDLSAHRSSIVSKAQINAAPAIFVFDLMNLAPIACRGARALRRTHLLAMLTETGSVFIPDPHGRSAEVLDGTLQWISQAVSAGSVASP